MAAPRNAAWVELDQMPDFSNARYANIFATPLITHVWDDGSELNSSLRERILVHETENPGIGKSNHGGWHSKTGQLEFCGDAGRRLIARMYELADEATRRVFAERAMEPPPCRWTLSAWANATGTATSTKCMCIPRRLGREPITSIQANRAIPIGVRRFTCSIPAKAAAWHSFAPCPRAFMCIRGRA